MCWTLSENETPPTLLPSRLSDNLHSFHKETGHTIGSFVHDEQDQFVPKFVEAFELISKFQGDEKGPLSMASDISPIETFDCTLKIRSSADSFGLQIVDVCLWLAKRVLEQNNVPRGQCATLWKCLIERSYIKEYDFGMLVREIRAGAELLEQRPLTARKMEDAKQILAQIEEARKKRLAANP